MARRRRREPDVYGIALAIGALAGIAMIAAKALPQVRTVIIIAAVGIGVFVMVVGIMSAVNEREKDENSKLEKEIGLGKESNALRAAVRAERRTLPNSEIDSSGRELNALRAAAGSGQPALPLGQIRAIDWFQFEKLVALAYSGTGRVTRKGGANPDGGIDLVLERNGELIGIQCKHWKSWTVGVKVVREMIGAMADAGLKKGMIVALDDFTAEARELAARHQIELVDLNGLMGLLKSLNQEEVQAIFSDRRKVCPRCEREMKLRTARRGANEGGQFWGCSGYPGCKQTLPFESV